jgi:hypothetical protein
MGRAAGDAAPAATSVVLAFWRTCVLTSGQCPGVGSAHRPRSSGRVESLMRTGSDLYHQDFYAWINGQAALLREGRVQDIDPELLAEELEAMGRRERSELVSRLIILIAHLLKWQYQPEHRTASWRGSIVEQRVQVSRELRLSPSLKAFLAEAIAEAYPDARHIASRETGLRVARFPAACPYSVTEVLDEDYWPDEPPG